MLCAQFFGDLLLNKYVLDLNLWLLFGILYMNIVHIFEKDVLQKIMPVHIFKLCKSKCMNESLQILKQEVELFKNEVQMNNTSNIKIYQLILLKYAQQ